MKEDINALAREYAEKFCDNLIYKEESAERDRLTDIRNISETASNFLQWLLISRCLVDKVAAINDWQHYNDDEFISARADDKEYNQWCKGAKHALEKALGKELFE